MIFTSFSYLLFLPVAYLAFYFGTDRWRWFVLLIASYGFYASFKAPYLLAVLLMVTGISYVCGLCITTYEDEVIRKRWLWIGSLACLSILAIMKYLPFLESKANSILGFNSAQSSACISIGVSYFTFQAISYMADIYLEIEEEPERHIGRFALYMAFFPKLLQGPIERAGTLLPQLKQPYQFDYDAMRSGMLLFTWGLFKKTVVADRFALYADQVYNNVHNYTGISLIIGTYAYALQIYFDFSAYTDMARGTGRMFGINLSENFNSPYLATSVADFWRRWHISFSRWILDYIFRPLQMKWRQYGRCGTVVALIITFIISGIWHGPAWGFVIWGLLHGVYLASSVCYSPYQKKLHMWLGIKKNYCLKLWQIIFTFNIVSIAWIFFRANTLGDAYYFICNLFTGSKGLIDDLILSQGKLELLILLLTCIFYIIISRLIPFDNSRYINNIYIRWLVYLSIVMNILVFTVAEEGKFIYMQF